MCTPSPKMEMFTGNANRCGTQVSIDPMMFNHLQINVSITMLVCILKTIK